MKIFLLAILFFCRLPGIGQVSSREAFINEISGIVVDSSFAKFYLSSQARPSRFRKFDYGELVKYSLKETVALEILNELSRHVFEDNKEYDWAAGKIDKAICIDDNSIKSILNPSWAILYDPALNGGEKRRAIRKLKKDWDKKPEEEKLVYFFSKPEFTDDGQYAVVDLDFRCDEHECGRFSTYLFRLDHLKWKTIGIILAGGAGGE
jgi:hypothetical protein